MPTKKAQRRTVARRLKITGLPLPIRGRLAKLIVRSAAGTEIQECLAKAGCVVVRSYGDCSDSQCCSQYSHQVWNYNGTEFHTEYGLFNLPRTEPKKPALPPIDPKMVRKLREVEAEIEERRMRLATLEGLAEKLATDLVRAAFASMRGKQCPSWVEHGHWDCPTSPTKRCAYNHKKDPIHDFCIFCGEPEERK